MLTVRGRVRVGCSSSWPSLASPVLGVGWAHQHVALACSCPSHAVHCLTRLCHRHGSLLCQFSHSLAPVPPSLLPCMPRVTHTRAPCVYTSARACKCTCEHACARTAHHAPHPHAPAPPCPRMRPARVVCDPICACSWDCLGAPCWRCPCRLLWPYLTRPSWWSFLNRQRWYADHYGCVPVGFALGLVAAAVLLC